VAVLASVGCAPADANAPGIHLSAALTGDDVTLTWDGHRGGVVVEFATEPDGRYTILDFPPADRSTFEHPDLMPATTFYYRVRPVTGPTSAPATPVPIDVAPADEDWIVPRTVPDPAAKPAPGGAPTNLLARTVAPDGLLLTWRDNATDEAGYLVEAEVGGDFQVVYVVDRDVNSAGIITQESERAATYRVRAYRFGAQSNVVHEQTPG